MKFDKTLYKFEKELLTEMAYGFSHNAVKITRADLVEKLKNLQGKDIKCMFTSVTEPVDPKKPVFRDKSFKRVFKVSEVEGLLNTNYGERKQDLLNKHAPGTTYSPSYIYGVHTAPAVVEHTPKATGRSTTYIQVLPEKSASQKYIIKTNIGQYELTSKGEVADVLPVLKLPNPADVSGVVVRRYKIDSLVAIEFEGTSYEVSDVEVERAEVLKTINLSGAKVPTPPTGSQPPPSQQVPPVIPSSPPTAAPQK